MNRKCRPPAAGFITVLLGMILVPPAFPSSSADRTAETVGGLSFGGNIRFFSAYNSYTELKPLFPDSQTFLRSQLRLTAGGRVTRAVGFDIHVVQYTDYDSEPDTGVFKPRIGKPRYHVPSGPWEWSRGSWMAGLWLDRLNLRMSFPGADLTIGRQAVSFGKTYFWNPLDVFFPFRAWEFDRDYKEGVDALRLDIPMGRVTGFNLVAAPGKEVYLSEDFRDGVARGRVSWYGSALLARFHTTYRNWDAAVQAGKVYGGFHVGGGFSGETGSVDVRFESAYFIADGFRSRPLPDPLGNDLLENHLSAVLGVGWRFPYELDFYVEYFYNGAAGTKFIEGALLRMIHGSNTHLSTHLLAAVFRYPVLPILNADLAWIVSIPDHSFLVQPHLSLSLTNEMDLFVGAAFGVGDAPYLYDQRVPILRTEFGTYPNVVYVLLRAYF